MPSEADFEWVVEQIRTADRWLREKVSWLEGAAIDRVEGTNWPGWVKSAVKGCIRAMAIATRGVIRALEVFLEGLLAPVRLMYHVGHWGDVEASVGQVGTSVKIKGATTGQYWSGTAATRYTTAVGFQAGAATALADLAGKVRGALIKVIIATIAAYVAVVAAIVGFVKVLTASAAAATTGAGAPPAAAATVGKAAATVALIAGIGAALYAFVESTAGDLNTIYVAVNRADGMPDNHWPSALAAGYNDGSVLDNQNEWSVQS